MSLKSRTWACPDCNGQFTTIADDKDGPPRFCEKCGADMSADIEAIPNFSRISKPQNQTMDRVYRGMEAASYARAEAAAEMTGGKAEDFSMIRMTDMRDNLRAGDTSFKAPSVPKTAPTPNVVPMGGQVGLATSQMIRSSGGSVGQGVMDTFRKDHKSRAYQMQRAGQIGQHSGK